MDKLAVLLALTALTLPMGCEDEPAPEPPPPPNKPQILSASAHCRAVGVERQWVLEEIDLTARDLDGVGDLQPPEVIVLANRMPLTSTTVEWAPGCGVWCTQSYCPDSCAAECSDDAACVADCAADCDARCAAEVCPTACGEASCEAHYSWVRDPDAAQILCGESEDALQLEVEITLRDMAGFRAEAWVITEPL
ncbi:hypothetical protein KKB55_02990 [Myxococcota bacterium]|nr:hypothetical protein [Myxococcota bacterium]MBU1896718.1 hypothetical protein [Myxococcota bacterium]